MLLNILIWHWLISGDSKWLLLEILSFYTCFMQSVIIVPPLSTIIWSTLVNYFLSLVKKWIDLINEEVLPWCQNAFSTSLKFSNFSHFFFNILGEDLSFRTFSRVQKTLFYLHYIIFSFILFIGDTELPFNFSDIKSFFKKLM